MIFEEQLTAEQAKAIIKSGLGIEELKLATSFCAPLFWQVDDEGGVRVRNGTAFFIDAGEGAPADSTAIFSDRCSSRVEGVRGWSTRYDRKPRRPTSPTA